MAGSGIPAKPVPGSGPGAGIHCLSLIPAKETVSQFVIPAKFSEAGREPGSRTNRDDSPFLDSGSRSARPE